MSLFFLSLRSKLSNYSETSSLAQISWVVLLVTLTIGNAGELPS